MDQTPSPLYDQTGGVIDADYYGQIILVDCEDVTVHQGDFQGTSFPIQVAYCLSCVITGNQFSSAYRGLIIERSIGCEVSQNTFDNPNEDAILISDSSSCRVEGNKINGSSIYYYSTGVRPSSAPNAILQDNSFIRIMEGLAISSSDSVIVSKNRFDECGTASYVWSSRVGAS